jgi:membrane glycosyltransferase
LGIVRTPAIHRISIVPSKVELGRWRRIGSKAAYRREGTGITSSAGDAIGGEGADVQVGWRHLADRRRIALALIVVSQTAFATWSPGRTFSSPELSALQIAILVNFSFLVSWISFSF